MTPTAGMRRVSEIVASWMRGRLSAAEAMLAIVLVTGAVEEEK